MLSKPIHSWAVSLRAGLSRMRRADKSILLSLKKRVSMSSSSSPMKKEAGITTLGRKPTPSSKSSLKMSFPTLFWWERSTLRNRRIIWWDPHQFKLEHLWCWIQKYLFLALFAVFREKPGKGKSRIKPGATSSEANFKVSMKVDWWQVQESLAAFNF